MGNTLLKFDDYKIFRHWYVSVYYLFPIRGVNTSSISRGIYVDIMQQCIGSDLRSSQRTLYHRWLTSYREECYYLKCIVYGILRYSAVRRLLNTRLHIVYYITMGPGCQGHAPTSTLRYDRFLEINPRDWSCDLSVELPESKVVNFDGFFLVPLPLILMYTAKRIQVYTRSRCIYEPFNSCVWRNANNLAVHYTVYRVHDSVYRVHYTV